MASGTFYPGVNADDGYGVLPASTFASVGNVLYAGNAGGSAHSNWFRFLSVNIPSGATITEAYVKLTCIISGSNTICNINCYLEASDDAVAPVDIAAFNNLSLTSVIAWDSLSAWVDGTKYNTPSLVSILQNVVDRAGWSSGNAVQLVLKDNASTANAKREISAFDFSSGAEKAELHVTWETGIPVEITDGAGISDAYDSVVLAAIMTEALGISDFFDAILDTLDGEIFDDCGVNSALERSFETLSSATNGAGVADTMAGLFEYFGVITNNTGIADAYEKYVETIASLTDGTGLVDEYVVLKLFVRTVTDTLSAWDNLKWGWQKSIADSLAIVDTAEKILGIPVKDWLAIKDSELTNWNGVESVSDSFYAVDISKVIKVYFDLVADGMAVADAVKSALGLIIKDIFTCVDTALNIGQFQHSIEDGMTLADIAKRLFPKSVSDSFAVADISLVDFLVLLQISDSLTMVDTADRLLTINKAIADSLDVLDVVTIKQLIQELMQDGLNISASVIIDGEVYECWVLNTSSFHPSVYSNYEFNSFCIDKSNNICYGCKSDGIYTLEGDTDNGTDIKAGIILPDTDFGSSNKKRFRKAWLAVESNNLLLKVETESGSRTYGMTDAEISLTRDLKGRSWKFSVEGFDSLDSINLVPIILSKR